MYIKLDSVECFINKWKSNKLGAFRYRVLKSYCNGFYISRLASFDRVPVATAATRMNHYLILAYSLRLVSPLRSSALTFDKQSTSMISSLSVLLFLILNSLYAVDIFECSGDPNVTKNTSSSSFIASSERMIVPNFLMRFSSDVRHS